VRVTVQLIESETGTRLRVDRYDGTLDEVFDLQDRITASVVGWSSRIFGGPRSSARGASAPTVSCLRFVCPCAAACASAMPGDAGHAIGLLE
jgi:hypothetical protein